MRLMSDLDPLVLLLIGGGVAVAMITILRGGRFVARFRGNSLEAGGGVAIRNVEAGRNARVAVVGAAKVDVDGIKGGEHANVRVEAPVTEE